MEKEIREHIRSIEEEEDITALSCRSFGSHMMNLASESSDYDSFLIYAQDAEDYATIGGYKDTITVKHGEIDFQCWNIKKFGELVADSNPTAMEFLNSPVHYYENPFIAGNLHELKNHANDNFTPIALYYHYRSLAESNYYKYVKQCVYNDSGNRYPVIQEIEDDDSAYIVDISESDDLSGTQKGVYTDRRGKFELGNTKQTVKRNLFVVRGILYARYVRENHEFPNLNFPEFIEGVSDYMTDNEFKRLRKFIAEKKTGDAYRKVGNPFSDLIEREFEYELDHEKHTGRSIDRELVNELIRTSIKQ